MKITKQTTSLVRLCLLGFCFTCLLPLAAQAQSGTTKNISGPWYMQDYTQKWWRAEMLIGGELEPAYPGSKDYNSEVGGLIRGVFKDPWNNRYTIGLDGVSGAFDLRKDLALLVEIEAEEGDEGESADLDGLDKVEDTVEAQITLAQRWGDAYVFVSAQPDVLDRGKGWVYFAGGGYDWQPTDRFGFRNTLFLSGGNNTHMNTEFGISPEESERTGFRAYNPDAGIKTLALATQLEYELTPWCSLMTLTDLELYLGDGADGPLVKDNGSEVGIEALVGLMFRW